MTEDKYTYQELLNMTFEELEQIKTELLECITEKEKKRKELIGNILYLQEKTI